MAQLVCGLGFQPERQQDDSVNFKTYVVMPDKVTHAKHSTRKYNNSI
jgi:hypothetical protein